MESQLSFGAREYSSKKKITRREKFLAEMEEVVPWKALVGLIEPHYPKGQRGRPPMGVERMLRVYFLSQWYGLADEALEDAIYDSQAMRNFVGIDLSSESVPDATTLLKFRHLLEREELTKASSIRLESIYRDASSVCEKARSWTQPFSLRRPRRRTGRANAIPRCTRPARAMRGISA